jgi:hypothetical protein
MAALSFGASNREIAAAENLFEPIHAINILSTRDRLRAYMATCLRNFCADPARKALHCTVFVSSSSSSSLLVTVCVCVCSQATGPPPLSELCIWFCRLRMDMERERDGTYMNASDI